MQMEKLFSKLHFAYYGYKTMIINVIFLKINTSNLCITSSFLLPFWHNLNLDINVVSNQLSHPENYVFATNIGRFRLFLHVTPF